MIMWKSRVFLLENLAGVAIATRLVMLMGIKRGNELISTHRLKVEESLNFSRGRTEIQFFLITQFLIFLINLG